jgi:hypothetical protein
MFLRCLSLSACLVLPQAAPPAFARPLRVCAIFPYAAPNETTELIRSTAGEFANVINYVVDNDGKRIASALNVCVLIKVDAVIVASIEKFSDEALQPLGRGFAGELIVFDTRYPVSGLSRLKTLLGGGVQNIHPGTTILRAIASSRDGAIASFKASDIIRSFGPDQPPGSNRCVTSCAYDKAKECCEKTADKCDC